MTRRAAPYTLARVESEPVAVPQPEVAAPAAAPAAAVGGPVALGLGPVALGGGVRALVERQELELTPPRADRPELRALYADAF